MASAAEQLAANMNFGAFAKATELKRRLWFTLGVLIVYRIGTYIPVPGIDASVMAELVLTHGGGIRGGDVRGGDAADAPVGDGRQEAHQAALAGGVNRDVVGGDVAAGAEVLERAGDVVRPHGGEVVAEHPAVAGQLE